METNRMVVTVAVICTLITALSATAAGRIIYVDDDAAGAGDGSSWTNAFVYLQDALAVAGPGDEVWVAQGVYRPDQGASVRPPVHTGMYALAFRLNNGVALKGGFAGAGAEDPDVRDVEAYEAVLSGDLNGNDTEMWGPGNRPYDYLKGDNSLHVVASIGTDSTAVLDGFVIEAATDSGLYNRDGGPHVANCVFRYNTGANGGSGLRCEGGQPSLSNCVFRQNSTMSSGGAIFVSQAQLDLRDCRFVGNWAQEEGGAVYCVDSDLSLIGCELERNAAAWGGAIHQTGDTLTLESCTFGENAAGDGGAVAVAARIVSIQRCVFRRNWAINSGGAIESVVPVMFDRCTFSGNSARSGAAVHASTLSAPGGAPEITTMTRCLLTGNRAHGTGGALCSDRAELAIDGCTFADNWAPTGGTLGWLAGNPRGYTYRVTMDNCIARDGAGSISTSRPLLRGGGAEEVDVIVRYSDVQGGWLDEGNIDADPLFAGPGYWVSAADPNLVVEAGHADALWIEGDYHLKSQAGRWDPASESWVLDDVTSPCIDAGDPASPVGDEPEPNGGRVNMGAYGGTPEASKSHLDAP